MQNGSLQQLTVLDGRRHAVLSTMYAPLLQKVRYPDLSRGNLPLVDTQHQQHRVVPLQLHQVNPRHGLPSRASTPHNIARLTVSAPRVGVAVAPVSSTQSRGAQKLVLVNTNAATFKAPHGLVPQVRYSQAQPAIAVKSVTETRFAPRGKKNVRHQVCVPVTPSGDCKRVRINSHVEPRRLKLVSMALNGSVDLSHGVLFIDDVDQLDLTASTTASDPVKADHQSSLLSPTLPCASRYKTELCRSFEEQGTCKYGEKCQFAHGRDELRQVSRHPKYKTEYCRTYHASGFCPYGQRCHFVHDERSCDTAVASQPALTAIYADTDCVRVNQRQRHTVPFTSASFDDALAGAVEQLTASYTSMPVQRSVNSLEALKSDPLNDALMSALACSTPVTQCAGTYEWNDCVAGSVSASTSTSDDSGVLCLPDKRAVCATQLSAEHTSIETARRESDGDSDEHSTSTTADVAWFDVALDRLALDENNNVVDENGNLPDNWMVAAQQVVVAPNLQHAQYRHESAIASPDGMSAEKRLPIFETLAAAR